MAGERVSARAAGLCRPCRGAFDLSAAVKWPLAERPAGMGDSEGATEVVIHASETRDSGLWHVDN